MMLWPDQVRGCTMVRQAIEEGAKRVILCSPPGTGKTVMSTALAQEFLAADLRCMFMAPRIELIQQLCKKLDEWLPLGYGLITARQSAKHGTGVDLYNRVQVASVDTLVSRAVKRGNLVLPPTDVVFLDECHLYTSGLRQQLLQLFGDIIFVGMSGTPAAPSGRGLGNIFQRLVEVTTPKKATRDGYLCPTEYFAPSRPDLSRARITAGEYNEKDVEVAMAPLLGDIRDHWLRFGDDSHTVLFAPSIPHSLYLRNRFLEIGVACEHIDSKMDPDTRRDVMERFKSQETQLLCNVGILEYGVDVPSIGCVVDCSPTKSIVRFLQRGGRGKRRCDGKRRLIYLDHAGNIHEHGYLEDDRVWDLEQGYIDPRPPKPRSKKAKGAPSAPRHLTCPSPECSAVFSGSLTCPVCGHYFEQLAREFQVVDGELMPFTTDDEGNLYARVKFYIELVTYAKQKGKKLRWCEHVYHERYKKWPRPRWTQLPPLEPSRETLRYIQHRNIQWARNRKSNAA